MAKRNGISLDDCPVCGSAESSVVQAQTLALAGLGTATIRFGYCRSCGHIYQVQRASDDLLTRHYACFSNYTCFDIEAARRAAPSKLTRRLLTFAETRAQNGLFYEVGCATGCHLVHFRRAGWRVGGCDPSAKAVAQAKDIYDIDVDCGTDAEMLPRHSDLSIVLFSHVLEHMADPLKALKHAHRALADDGVVLLEVPCATAPHLVPPGWFTFEHLHYFSEASLSNLLRAAGFEPA
jgi:SAM-dependent methyltransferase